MIIVASFFDARRRNLKEQHSIANKAPSWWKGPTIIQLHPGDIVWELKRNTITEEGYTVMYLQQLEKLHDHKFNWSSLEGKTLLCWEKTGQFCHRRLLAEFLRGKGFEVTVY